MRQENENKPIVITELIYNKKTSKDRLNISNYFTEVDWFMINVVGEPLGSGYRLPVSLVMDFLAPELPSKEIPLDSQIVDTNVMIQVPGNRTDCREYAKMKLCFGTSLELNLQIYRIVVPKVAGSIQIQTEELTKQVAELNSKLNSVLNLLYNLGSSNSDNLLSFDSIKTRNEAVKLRNVKIKSCRKQKKNEDLDIIQSFNNTSNFYPYLNHNRRSLLLRRSLFIKLHNILKILLLS